MTWNFRIVRHLGTRPGEEDWFAVHEVYYDETGHPNAVSEQPVPIMGDSKDEILEDLRRMQEATDKPTLDYVLFSNKEPGNHGI